MVNIEKLLIFSNNKYDNCASRKKIERVVGMTISFEEYHIDDQGTI